MKKLFLLLFFSSCLFIVMSSANAWETKITIKCINEKLKPCSSLDISYIESNKNKFHPGELKLIDKLKK